jgi:hypothetical protein
MGVYRVAALAAVVVLGTFGVARADAVKKDNICPNTYPASLAEEIAWNTYQLNDSLDNYQGVITKKILLANEYAKCAAAYVGVDGDKTAYAEFLAASNWEIVAEMERDAHEMWRPDMEKAWQFAHSAVNDAISPGVRKTAQDQLDEIAHVEAQPD